MLCACASPYRPPPTPCVSKAGLIARQPPSGEPWQMRLERGRRAFRFSAHCIGEAHGGRRCSENSGGDFKSPVFRSVGREHNVRLAIGLDRIAVVLIAHVLKLIPLAVARIGQRLMPWLLECFRIREGEFVHEHVGVIGC